MISQDDIARIQEELGRLALEAVRIDVDGSSRHQTWSARRRRWLQASTCEPSPAQASGPRWHGC